VRFGSKNRRKDVEKMRPRRRWRASAGFSLILGLVASEFDGAKLSREY
jgi:hypothetical protein